jgi:hypothetical protein
LIGVSVNCLSTVRIKRTKMKKLSDLWELLKALLWIGFAVFLIAINHPSIQKMFSLILPGRLGIWWNKHF